MFHITKEFNFSCAHRLYHLREGHKCRNLHGHNYKLLVSIYSDVLNNDNFIIDFGELKLFQKFLDQEWDHKVIIDKDDKELIEFCQKIKTNYLVFDSPVTAENMAKYFSEIIFYKMKINIKNLKKVSVTVFETETSSATYEKVN